MESKKTILVSVYAVHPTKGSEDAMGWNYTLQIARYNNVISITRENNREAIEEYIAAHPSPIFDNITFAYYDLPYWMRFWKKGSRGAMLYYWMWQRGMPAFIRRNKLKFDVAHNATFPNDWTPSYLWKLGKPFVWGPIGHHPIIPKQYLKPYSVKYLIKDRLTWLIKNAFWKFSIGLKKTAKNADFIYSTNSSVGTKIRLQNGKHFVRPSVGTQDFGYSLSDKTNGFHVISAGRFVPLKSFDLTILSFAKFIKRLNPEERKSAKLTLVGDGPELDYLQSLIRKNSIENYVEIILWVEREELMKMMKTASVMLFPSHEGAGMVVAEAFSFALPVICLDNIGPGEFVTQDSGITIPIQSYDDTTSALAKALHMLQNDKEELRRLSHGARERFQNTFHWDKRGDWLQEIYTKIS